MQDESHKTPDWLLDTPLICYTLAAGNPTMSDHPFQEIELTYDEYNALKRHLAELRDPALAISAKVREFRVLTSPGNHSEVM